MATAKKKVVTKQAPAKKAVATKAAPAKKAAGKATKAVDTSNMTPIQKAQAARAANKASGKKPAARKTNAIPTFQAPEDFKPCFVEVSFRTDVDGLIAAGHKAKGKNGEFNPGLKATLIQGTYRPENQKRFDLADFDVTTLLAISSRLAGVLYAPNQLRRLRANAQFKIVYRVGRRSADNSLIVGTKFVLVPKANKNGRIEAVELDKKDPEYRKIRKAQRTMPGAFKFLKQPPKPASRRSKAEEDDE